MTEMKLVGFRFTGGRSMFLDSHRVKHYAQFILALTTQ